MARRRSNESAFDPAALYEDATQYTTPPRRSGPASGDGHDSQPSSLSSRPPPSSFVFPFQHHTGNPDPGTNVPRAFSTLSVTSRRSSDEGSAVSPVNRSPPGSHTGHNSLLQASGLEEFDEHLVKPSPPFARGKRSDSASSLGSNSSPRSSTNSLYRNSAAAAAADSGNGSTTGFIQPSHTLQGRSSNASFRPAMLSPASRATSRPGSLWSPPTYPAMGAPDSPNASAVALGTYATSKPPAASTRIPEKLSKEDKPWLQNKSRREKVSWWITFVCILLGIGGSAVLCWQSVSNTHILDENTMCIVMDEDWSSGDISSDRWVHDAGLGGWGNGEFQAHVVDSGNSYVRDGQLYILPTLMSDAVGGKDKVIEGGSYEVRDCTFADSNKTACSVESDGNTVLPPVLSARLTTSGKATIDGGKGGGKVTVRAKLPRGDWLWPSIWMLPQDSDYGEWPLSGEIDIMEARGNRPSYGAQGSNYVRGSLNYGPMPELITRIYGWWTMKRGGFETDFHDYTLEWTPDWMRVYVDSRLQATLDLKIKGSGNSFWDRGDYPATQMNSSSGKEVVVDDIYGKWSSNPSAPFDKPFYLIISVAAGGTSGWFPDDIGDKPWYDEDEGALSDFVAAQDTWFATWPSDDNERAMRVESVKMWRQYCD